MPSGIYGDAEIEARAGPTRARRFCSTRLVVVVVTPGASVSFFRAEFNDFLYAPVGADGSEMPLSVLSALSRLDVDPWQEAAELADLPPDTATKRLASLLAHLPGGRWPQADLRTIADRLIELLPRPGSSKGTGTETARRLHAMTHSTLAKMLICAAIGAMAVFIAANRQPSSRTDHTDVPASNAATPPQVSPPSSR
jgi:hypothetical protein